MWQLMENHCPTITLAESLSDLQIIMATSLTNFQQMVFEKPNRINLFTFHRWFDSFVTVHVNTRATFSVRSVRARFRLWCWMRVCVCVCAAVLCYDDDDEKKGELYQKKQRTNIIGKQKENWNWLRKSPQKLLG